MDFHDEPGTLSWTFLFSFLYVFLFLNVILGHSPKIVGQIRGVFSFGGTLAWVTSPSWPPPKPTAGSASVVTVLGDGCHDCPRIASAAVHPPATDVVIVLGRVRLVQVPAQVAPGTAAPDPVPLPPVVVPAVRGPVGHQVVQVLGQLFGPGEVRDVDEGAGRCYLFV